MKVLYIFEPAIFAYAAWWMLNAGTPPVAIVLILLPALLFAVGAMVLFDPKKGK